MNSEEKLKKTLLDIFNHIMNYDSTINYTRWYVDIITNPDKTGMNFKTETSINHFKSWDLEDKSTAYFLKKYLIEKGCKEGKPETSIKTNQGDHRTDPTFLCVYRIMQEAL